MCKFGRIGKCCFVLSLIIMYIVVVRFFVNGQYRITFSRNGAMRFCNGDGTLVTETFVDYLGQTYYVDANGDIEKNVWIDNGNRFLNDHGELIRSRANNLDEGLNERYYFDDDGYRLKHGYYDIGKHSIYVDENDRLAYGYFYDIKDKGMYCYIGDDGFIWKNKGFTDIKGSTYYISKNGNIPRDGWHDIEGAGRFYMLEDGAILKNQWLEDSFYLDKKGKMLTNKMTPDGVKVDKDGYIMFTNDIKDRISSLDNGESITFGRYMYDENVEKTLEWILLDKSDEKALLITKDVVDVCRYNYDYEEVSWEDSTLRDWLNDDFKYKAFNMNEIQFIENNTIENNVNNVYGLEKEEDTVDQIFILSKEEHKQSFGYPDYKTGYNIYARSKATPYAKTKDVYEEDGYSNYWLRDNGYDKTYNIQCLYTGGLDIFGVTNVTHNIGVRPCIVLNYTKEYNAKN